MTGLWSSQEEKLTRISALGKGVRRKAKAAPWGRGQLGQSQQGADSSAQDSELRTDGHREPGSLDKGAGVASGRTALPHTGEPGERETTQNLGTAPRI